MRKNDKGREDTLLAKMYGSNSSIQGQIHLFKRLGGLGRGRTREGGGRNESILGKGNLAVGFECMLGARIHGAELGAMYSSAEHGFKIHGQVSLAEAALISSSSLSVSSSPQPVQSLQSTNLTLDT